MQVPGAVEYARSVSWPDGIIKGP